jgi:hypothetical protein
MQKQNACFRSEKIWRDVDIENFHFPSLQQFRDIGKNGFFE